MTRICVGISVASLMSVANASLAAQLPAATNSAVKPTAMTAVTKPAPVQNPLVWDAMEKTIDPTPDQVKVEFTFNVTNTATTNVSITQVYPSCGCTTPSLPPLPWKIDPGQGGPVKATVDIRGKTGNLVKTLTVVSSVGSQLLTLKINIPKSAFQLMQEREMNLNIAKADRQAVFRSDCVRCHYGPIRDKVGEPLYVAACAVCHDPKKWAVDNPLSGGGPASHSRNQIVPDLGAFKFPLNRQYWKITIANGGKPKTLMPAFSKAFGGPLTDEQIDSVVDYCLTAFPYNPMKAATNAAPATTTTTVTNSVPATVKGTNMAAIGK